MEKTIKQIADELKIDKQKVYRLIKKNCIKEAYQKNGAMYYDEVAQTFVKTHFRASEVRHNTHQEHIKSTSSELVNQQLIDMLREELKRKDTELKAKNEQILNLNNRLAEANANLSQEQHLHSKTMQELEAIREENQLLCMPKEEPEVVEVVEVVAEPETVEEPRKKKWWQRR